MSFADLPSELLDVIFEPLPHSTLASLTVTCSFFTNAATRHLYRHLSLSSYTNNLEAVFRLADRPELGSLVRSFSISVDDSDEVSPEYYTALGQALQNMLAIQSLQLHVGAHASWILKPSSQNASRLRPRLEDMSTSFPLDENLASFFTSTPSLVSLQLGSSFSFSDIADLHPSTLPHLASYTGPAAYLRQIVPGRPLASLHLSGDLAIEDVELFAEVSSAPDPSVVSVPDRSYGGDGQKPRVEVLSAITSAPPVLILEALARTCPLLVCLRVMTTCAFWQAPDLTFYSQIALTLSSLQNLSAFELSGMHWESRTKSASSSDDGTCSDKEWISPPVTPRVLELNEDYHDGNEYSFEEAFMEWAY